MRLIGGLGNTTLGWGLGLHRDGSANVPPYGQWLEVASGETVHKMINGIARPAGVGGTTGSPEA